MSPVKAEPIHDGGDVVDGALPAVGRRIRGNVARRIAAGIVSDAAIPA
jgi:hypothetical protein